MGAAGLSVSYRINRSSSMPKIDILGLYLYRVKFWIYLLLFVVQCVMHSTGQWRALFPPTGGNTPEKPDDDFIPKPPPTSEGEEGDEVDRGDGSSSNPSPPPSEERHLILAVSWLPTLCQYLGSTWCENQRYDDGPDRFGTHGLWVQSNPGTETPTENCEPECWEELTHRRINTLRGMRIGYYWPALRGTDVDFWQHEWKKHGSCCEMHQLEYFESTLLLFKDINMERLLSRAGITKGNSYSAVVIIGSIQRKLGKKPSIACYRIHREFYTDTYLLEIYLRLKWRDVSLEGLVDNNEYSNYCGGPTTMINIPRNRPQ